MAKNDRYVVKHEEGWAVKKPGADRASSLHDTQRDAERAAKEIVSNLGGGEVRIQGRDGQWRDSDKHYTAYLSDADAVSLTRLFQQRHLLAHTQGIVDSDYATRAGDSTYQVGQRLVIREAAVRQCLSLIEKLTAGMAFDAPT